MAQTAGERVGSSKETKLIIHFDGKADGGLIIWAGIIGNTIVVLIRVPEGVKLTSKTHSELLESVLLSRLEDLSLSSRRKVIFMHDNATSHSVKATTSFVASLGIEGDSLMDWPLRLPDLNP